MIFDGLIQSKLFSSIKQEALRLGLSACGISSATHLEQEEEYVEQWLREGKHGEMSWMERNKDKRYDPSKLVPGAKSVITVLDNYKTDRKPDTGENYKISSYAYGKDYHIVLKDKLHRLLAFIEEKTGKRKARVFVDSAPVLDRAWAHRSGLGFIGKNTMLINRTGGSYFFIGHIILDLELSDEKNIAEKNFCGSCTLCIKACPTQALEPFKLDARKCISYLTIEHKSEIPEKFKGKMDNWIFGCDICQDVCPWNRDAEPHKESLYLSTESLLNMQKSDWQNLDDIRFRELFDKSPLKRAGLNALLRNIKFLDE